MRAGIPLRNFSIKMNSHNFGVYNFMGLRGVYGPTGLVSKMLYRGFNSEILYFEQRIMRNSNWRELTLMLWDQQQYDIWVCPELSGHKNCNQIRGN